jgi:hypothetical protein
MGLDPVFIIARKRLLRIRWPGHRFDAGAGRGRVEVACCGARTDHGSVKWNYSKMPSETNRLQKNFNHKRVLFVQHHLEKGQSPAVSSGSFIACAEVLGNCDGATEGGIPRSSRFRWFA